MWYYLSDINALLLSYRSVRNLIIDLRRVNATTPAIGIHWQVSQSTSLINVAVEMSQANGTQHQGIGPDVLNRRSVNSHLHFRAFYGKWKVRNGLGAQWMYYSPHTLVVVSWEVCNTCFVWFCAQSSLVDIVFNGGMSPFDLDFTSVNRGRQKWDFCWQPAIHCTEYYCH